MHIIEGAAVIYTGDRRFQMDLAFDESSQRSLVIDHNAFTDRYELTLVEVIDGVTTSALVSTHEDLFDLVEWADKHGVEAYAGALAATA